jgi:hypothetical protein
MALFLVGEILTYMSSLMLIELEIVLQEDLLPEILYLLLKGDSMVIKAIDNNCTSSMQSEYMEECKKWSRFEGC